MTQVTIMTGEERRRKWNREDRERILAAAFAPGAVVAKVARQLDVASSLIYTWRRQMEAFFKLTDSAYHQSGERMGMVEYSGDPRAWGSAFMPPVRKVLERTTRSLSDDEAA